jgi:hypothetical protein
MGISLARSQQAATPVAPHACLRMRPPAPARTCLPSEGENEFLGRYVRRAFGYGYAKGRVVVRALSHGRPIPSPAPHTPSLYTHTHTHTRTLCVRSCCPSGGHDSQAGTSANSYGLVGGMQQL